MRVLYFLSRRVSRIPTVGDVLVPIGGAAIRHAPFPRLTSGTQVDRRGIAADYGSHPLLVLRNLFTRRFGFRGQQMRDFESPQHAQLRLYAAPAITALFRPE